MTGIRLIAAAAMLAGSVVAAGAQTSPSAPSAATPGATKCWDSAMNKVRNETTQAPGSTAGSGSTTGPSSMSGSAGSASGSAGPAAQTRPAEARGLPDCRH